VGLTQTADGSIELVGRIALATQGVLYGIMGVLAVEVARGHQGARASQHGAIEATARQPFGRWLLAVLAAGLAIHALWRLALMVRGEPGDGDDAGSVAKRAANAGRSLVYVSFTVAALRILMHAGGTGGRSPQRSVADVFAWPAGTALVVSAGVAVGLCGLWNIRKGVTKSFVENLELGRLGEGSRKAVETSGMIGYAARGAAFGLVGWFLLEAGLHHDPGQTRSLDQALLDVADTGRGVWMLACLAAGLIAFGAYRVLDGLYRRQSEVTNG
jgi:Domain of Unknown Function (DUF1206)